MSTISTTHYASIGKRFVAVLIDNLLLQVMFFIAYGKPPMGQELSTPRGIGANLLAALIAWLYFAVMESSSLQATFGKRLLSIIVTDTKGNKIFFGRATLRYLAKSLWLIILFFALIVALMSQTISAGKANTAYLAFAGLLILVSLCVALIGYLMAFFTPEKQALHDMIARCIVVNGGGEPVTIPWKSLIAIAFCYIILGRVVVGQLPGTVSTNTVSPISSNTQLAPTNAPTAILSIPSTSNNQQNPPAINNDNSNNTNNTNSVFGELVPANTTIYGVWELNFANGVTQHQALLSMRGTSGVMVVRFLGDKGVTQIVRQNMTLWSSAKGLVLIGNNPIDTKTNTLSPTYAPDNFFIATRPDNSVVLRNYSLSGANKSLTESPVERKFLGYPSIGINMVELTPEKRNEINQQNNLPLVNRDNGVLVLSVNDNSTALRSGVKAGDVIISINENNVTNVKQVQTAIQSSGLDSVLNFNVDRSGESVALKVSVGCCYNPQQKVQK